MNLSNSIMQSHLTMVEGRDVPWLLKQWVERTPDKPFLIWEPFEGETRAWSYAEIAQQVKSVTSAMHKGGIEFGDRILLHMDNSPEFIISWFACAHIGAIAVSTNTRSVARDMSYFADQAGVVAAITQPCFAELVHQNVPDIKLLAITDNDAGVAAVVPQSVPHIPFAELQSETAPCPNRKTDAMASLGIQFTSGTTSRPKGVLWTHANAIWGAQMNAAHMRLSRDDIALVFLPMFHTNSQSYAMLGSLWVGGTMVLQPKFSGSRFWSTAVKHKCTWTSMIPFCVKAVLQQEIPEKHSFRFWNPAVHLPDIEAATGIKSFGWWGMTETITHGIVGDIDHPGPTMCIGRVSSGYDIKILRPDGSHIDPGERGRLYIRGVRGVSLFKEYYANKKATDEAFDEDGWFDTGDAIVMDEEGNLFFGDREKDMLRVGAENVAASEVEAVIMETGWVRECAVVGQKHHMLDEVPVAFAIPNSDAPKDLKDRIIAVCVKNLPAFKVVRDVILVDDLPRGTLEKVAKNELRERLPTIDN